MAKKIPKAERPGAKYVPGYKYPITSEFYSDRAVDHFKELKKTLGVRAAKKKFYSIY